jgi:hypothetical protein
MPCEAKENKQERCDHMATKSVLKSVNLRTRKSATALVIALERAKARKARPVKTQRVFTDASREDIRCMFEVRK